MIETSIIMCTYNCKSYEQLEQSVKSIILQTYKDWELIICNDGSSNNTMEMLNEVSKMDKRIKIISHNPNQGLAYSLNACLKYAKGKYIVRQDDDDISMPNRLQCQIDFIKNNPQYSIVGSNAELFDSNGICGELIEPEFPQKTDFRWSSPFIHPAVVMRKKDLLKVGGYRVSKETIRAQDYDLFMRMYSKGMKGYNIQEKLLYYRVYGYGTTKKKSFQIRWGEVRIRYSGFKSMGILHKSLLYVLKPILIYCIPVDLINKIKNRFI